MRRDDKLRCFGCHATNATEGRRLTLQKMSPGVQCERCHGPAGKHLAGVKAGKPALPGLKDLSTLSTEQLSNFCGGCHRTWEEIAVLPTLDIMDIRFQPYRLTGSKCYDADDARINCVACHDPHHDVDSRRSNYDSKCQACHGGGKPGAMACTVAQKNCVSCHMPKIELPGSHYKFSDHRIRIVKVNEPFPA